MLRLSEAVKNKVMRIKIVYFGIRLFQNFYVATWDPKYLKKIYFLEASKRIYHVTQKLFAHIALL